MGGLQKFHLVSILLTLATAIWFSACGAAAPTAGTTAVTQNYIFSAYVESAITDEDIPNAQVTIHVPNRAPLEGFTDANGYVRIPFDTTYAGKAARLFVEAEGYQKQWQEINLSKEMLPDMIRLSPLSSSPDSAGEPTADSVALTKQQPTVESLPPTEQPTQETAFTPPTSTATQRSTPTDPPTDTPVPTAIPTLDPPTATTPGPDLTGRLAIPLILNTTPKVYIADMEGNLLGDLDMARQPDYTLDGTQLVVNGDGGGLDKLRISNAIGKEWVEIGDPSLGGHSHPAWSPDGTQLIYDDGTIDPAGWHIFRCGCGERTGEGERLDATNNRPIVNPNPLYPLWTTNDRFIFRGCNTWSGGGQCGLWMMQGNLNEPTQLTFNPNHIPTDIFEDTVVFTSDEAGDRNIYTLSLSTGQTRQLTFNPASDGLSTISPDGKTVAFLSNRGGILAVWTMSITGGPAKKMFDLPAEWGTLRADGWSDERLSWGRN